MRCDPFPLDTKDETPAFEVIEGKALRRLVLTCDHASNRVPPPYGDLGLGAASFERHIAYDIGMRGVTAMLAERLGATAVMSTFSRLLIDPNRGEDDPTLVMRLSDGDLVPGNARVDRAEVERRVARYHRPYHAAITERLDALLAKGETPVLLAMHSFTPRWKTFARPWHVGLLWDLDDRLARPLLEALRAEGDIEVGDNEPYDGALIGDGMNRHGTNRGLPHALVEIRQDLVADAAGQAAWAERFARLVPPILELPETRRVAHYGSRAGARRPR
ncbi:N-formylglutamate amidohydrolase [Chelatococcus sambhunathii]|uniref:N-formylglutamate amidohydrolase n=1 Tax=Chelatococcus sambhunathii TaxID=363953 RepID=A0ABU1DJ15_9HYPH|nr:N-formylglutamate amidohydrolase [Chelatococcus sambhunathii]MDR4307880.1 N-formylglutamate amidohydrolase [Chelatococcus sambhunathii]